MWMSVKLVYNVCQGTLLWSHHTADVD